MTYAKSSTASAHRIAAIAAGCLCNYFDRGRIKQAKFDSLTISATIRRAPAVDDYPERDQGFRAVKLCYMEFFVDSSIAGLGWHLESGE